jgi:pimeloyl-ACP methyl ester carboxylesterase
MSTVKAGSFVPRRVDTKHGVICAYTRGDLGDPTLPICLFLHGALRGADALAPVIPADELPYRSILIDLPGHGGSFHPEQITIDTLCDPVADIVHDAIGGQPCIVVGESLGGLLALRLAQRQLPNLMSAVAVDPILDTAKLLHVHDTMRQALSLYPGHPFVTALADNIFGVRVDRASAVNRSYRYLLDDLRVPTLVLTGDKRSPRHRFDEPGTCMLDDEDLAYLAGRNLNALSLVTLPHCGHLALAEQPREALRAITYFMRAAPSRPGSSEI